MSGESSSLFVSLSLTRRLVDDLQSLTAMKWYRDCAADVGYWSPGKLAALGCCALRNGVPRHGVNPVLLTIYISSITLSCQIKRLRTLPTGSFGRESD